MRAYAVVFAAALALTGCGTPAEDATDDAGDATPSRNGSDANEATDASADGADVPVDRGVVDATDGGADVVRDATDAARDVAADRIDAGDAATDAARDVSDATVDATVDGGLRCASEMTLVDGRVCVDRWEAGLVEVTLDGGVQPWSPYNTPGTRRVRAVSRAGAQPQGYISGAQAQAACREAGKRLCVLDEWLAACRGPRMQTYPYGETYVARRCNEGRAVHPVIQFFGTSVGVFTYENMNNPGINMQADTVANTGAFTGCVSPWGAFDMVGNLHEWIADPNGTFKGGFYVDAVRNGPGCLYTTTAHEFAYHDYSTGFRCCADPTR